MKEVHWGEALNAGIQYNDRDKVLLIMFADNECEICNAMIPHVEQLESQNSDEYEVLVVKDFNGFPFPPATTPMSYVFIPGNQDSMPMKRIGYAPPDALNNDIYRQIRAFKEGRSYTELLDEDRASK